MNEQLLNSREDRWINEICRKYNLDCTEDERLSFDKWRQSCPTSSLDNPIISKNVAEIIELLPQAPNYDQEHLKTVIYLSVQNLPRDWLMTFCRTFAQKSGAYEIALNLIPNNILAISIGDKRSSSVEQVGTYIGHYHPILHFSDEQNLPRPFVNSLMPSRGDVRAFFENPTISGKSTIFSPAGYVKIIIDKKRSDFDEQIKSYADYYFGLFEGENPLGLDTEQDICDYFKEHFGLTVEFNDWGNTENQLS